MHAHVSLDPNDMADDVSSRDIEVQVFNETDDDNIIVLVFARRYPIPLTTETMRMAWRALKIPSKGNIKFMFPLKNSIGAFYYDEENRISSGRFEAEPGSTWIAKTQRNGQITLEQVVDASLVPDGGYVVFNQIPEDSSWTGKIINVALYKGENSRRPLLSKQCRVGNYVTLTSTDKLYFAAVIPAFSAASFFMTDALKDRNTVSIEPVEFSDDLTLFPDAEISDLTMVDLLKYQYGRIQVKLEEKPYSGELVFTAESLAFTGESLPP